jgi:hypothetical protein
MSDKKSHLRTMLVQLERLVTKMDVPVYKRNNPVWLKKHLRVKNEAHPSFQDAMRLVEELLSNGVGHG